MTQYRVKFSRLNGRIKAPPSKSQSMRAILLASMAMGESIVHNCFNSPDASAMINACRALGAVIKVEKDCLIITGVAGRPKLPDDVINAGNSGQVLRFVAAIAGLLEEGAVVFTGDHSLRHNRPMAPMLSGLTQLGATCISTKDDGRAPLLIKGPIKPGLVHIDGQDSQPVSALIMVGAMMSGTTTINVDNPGETPWVGLTLEWLERLGVSYTNDNFQRYTITGQGKLPAFEYTVPGDFSAIAFPLAAALVSRSSIQIDGIDMNEPQGDKKIIQVLQAMGAEITLSEQSVFVNAVDDLHGIEIDVNDMIDALPVLSSVACFAKGTSVLYNAGIARFKESDRLSAMCSELSKMGANIKAQTDRLIIKHSDLVGCTVQSHSDHRIAMALAVAGCGAAGSTLINDVQCVAKSYREFVPDMQALGLAIEEIA